MKINKEYYYVLLSLLLFLLISTLDTFFAENTIDYELNEKTLVDVIHNNFKSNVSQSIPNNIVLFIFCYSILRFIFIDPNVVSYMFILLSIIFLLRLFAFTVTQTPPPYSKYDKKRYETCHRTVLGHLGLSISKSYASCIDSMFSGHAATSIIAAMMIILFSKYVLEVVIFILLIIINLFLISVSRLHYTSDVYISSIITGLLLFAFPFTSFVKVINKINLF